jgi:hypothetical protein
MAITYTWKVTGVKVKDEGANTNAIVQTYWQKIGTDEAGNEGTFSGATPFTSTTMPTGDTFVPFAELTEATVLQWIKDVVIGGYEEHVNAQIAKQIQDKITPVAEPGLPWAPVVEVPVPTTTAPV